MFKTVSKMSTTTSFDLFKILKRKKRVKQLTLHWQSFEHFTFFDQCIYIGIFICTIFLKAGGVLRKIEYTVSEEFNGTPLYYFLREGVGVSTRIIQTLRHTPKSVFINGSECRVIDKVETEDKIEIFLPEKTEAPLLWETDLDVIYEDEDLLIINKPSGVSVHPTRNHPNGTLCNAVAAYLKKQGNENFVARFKERKVFEYAIK